MLLDVVYVQLLIIKIKTKNNVGKQTIITLKKYFDLKDIIKL